ncbi:MAG: zinc-ribbon domain-containing protein [Anaeromyxobacter sp.]
MVIGCEQCGTQYELDETLLAPEGSEVQCARCQHVFTVRAGEPAAAAAPAVEPAAPAPAAEPPPAPAAPAPAATFAAAQQPAPRAAPRSGPAVYRPAPSAPAVSRPAALKRDVMGRSRAGCGAAPG